MKTFVTNRMKPTKGFDPSLYPQNERLTEVTVKKAQLIGLDFGNITMSAHNCRSLRIEQVQLKKEKEKQKNKGNDAKLPFRTIFLKHKFESPTTATTAELRVKRNFL